MGFMPETNASVPAQRWQEQVPLESLEALSTLLGSKIISSGSLSRKLWSSLGIFLLMSGDWFSWCLKDQSPLGLLANTSVESGELSQSSIWMLYPVFLSSLYIVQPIFALFFKENTDFNFLLDVVRKHMDPSKEGAPGLKEDLFLLWKRQAAVMMMQDF